MPTAAGSGVRTTAGPGATSSFAIVPFACAAANVALAGADSVTVKVSSGSNVASPITGTEMVLEVTPAANVSVPDAAV